MPDISICIIAKNEEQNIYKCLRSIVPMQSEIIVVDTGSVDRTVQIASSFTDKIYHFDWCDDFSAARNFCADKASNDYILSLDCDECLVLADILLLQKNIIEHEGQIGLVNRITPYPADDVRQSKREQISRLFDRRLFKYEGNVQEMLVAIDKSKVKMSGDIPSHYEAPLTFYHNGFSNIDIQRQKAERDLSLLQDRLRSEKPTSYIYYQIGKCYVAMKDYALAAHYFDLGINMIQNTNHTYIHEMIENYGNCLIQLKQYDKALALEKVYDDFCDRADFVYIMGLVYLNNNRFDDALCQFQKASTMTNYSMDGVNSYLAYYNMGLIYESRNDINKAIDSYSKCGGYAPAIHRMYALK